MEKLHSEIIINEPREKVWKVMFDDASYREWTAPFNEGGSWFEGTWETGSDIRFFGPDPETGKVGGIISRIKEAREPAFMSIEHLGIMKDGIDDFDSEEVKQWAPAFENYTFEEIGNSTHLSVDQDIDPQYKQMFETMWGQALAKLKEIAERS